MTARLGRVVLGLALLLTTISLAGPAVADGGYPASVVTRTEVVTDPSSPVRVGIKIDAVATVTSDAPDPARGTVELSVDGQVIAVLPVGDGTVRAPIPANLRTAGDHVVAAEYIPATDSPYNPSSDTYDLRVLTGSGIDGGIDGGAGAGADAGQDSDGGVLPNTGGIWLGFVLLGLLAIGVGSYLVDRHRKREARRRRRNRPFVPADLPEELKV